MRMQFIRKALYIYVQPEFVIITSASSGETNAAVVDGEFSFTRWP